MAFSLPTLAAGVSITSCHYGRNLATKTNHKNTIMASITQPDQLASSVFVSPSSLFLQRNGLTTPRLAAKRPAKVVAMAGTPNYTELVFENKTSSELILKEHNVWEGDDISEFTVKASDSTIIRHSADVIGSVGAVALTQKTTPQILWIVAWSNKTDCDNQVLVSIRNNHYDINWDNIKGLLDDSTSSKSDSYKLYKSDGKIDPNSGTPKLKATLSK